MTTPPSPAAQELLLAHAKARCLSEWSSVNDPPCHPSDSDWQGCVTCLDRQAVAAVLIAAADQVLPDCDELRRVVNPAWRTRWDIRGQLLDLAAELRQEGQP
jgi:hypothetical protein